MITMHLPLILSIDADLVHVHAVCRGVGDVTIQPIFTVRETGYPDVVCDTVDGLTAYVLARLRPESLAQRQPEHPLVDFERQESF